MAFWSSKIPSVSAVLAIAASLAILPFGATAQADTSEGDPLDTSKIWFIAPLPNAVFDGAPFDIEVQVGVHHGNDGGIDLVALSIDDGPTEVLDCYEGCTFTLPAVEEGMHTLSISPQETSAGDTETITIYVEETMPTAETGGEESGRGESGGEESGGGESGGEESGGGESGGGSTGTSSEESGSSDDGSDVNEGGCSVGGDPSAPWGLLALPALLLLPGVRRRRGPSRT